MEFCLINITYNLETYVQFYCKKKKKLKNAIKITTTVKICTILKEVFSICMCKTVINYIKLKKSK